MMPGLSSGNVSSGAVIPVTPASVSFTANSKGSTTYNNVSIGTAAANRRIVVAVSTARIDSTTPAAHASVTVAGVSCTKLSDAAASSVSAGHRTTIWITNSAIASGTTAQIVVSVGSASYVGIGVWALYDLASTTPYNTKTATGTGALSVSIDVPDNGVVISAATLNAPTSATITWAGATESYDGDNALQKFGGAAIAGLSAQTGRTVSATQSSSSALGGAMVAVALA